MKLTLYQFKHCPFCAKVRAWLEQHERSYEVVNVANDREDPLRKKLHEKTGIWTVPVLDADGEWIGDSEKIILFLEEAK